MKSKRVEKLQASIGRNERFLLNGLNGDVPDVFYNRFDKTWAEIQNEDGSPVSRNWTKLPIEMTKDDGTVDYTLNQDYFRCDDFTSEHKGKHILFAGCSQTEGIGAPLETVWSKLLLNKINQDEQEKSGFYTIAKAGFGWQKVVSNFMIYVDKYGAPEYLFVLLPNVGRFFQWDINSNRYVYVQRYPNGSAVSVEYEDKDRTLDPLLTAKPLTLTEHRKCFVDFVIGWKLFEKYCESIGTKMLWASWDHTENENYKSVNISKNYVDVSAEELMKFIRAKRPDGKIGKFDLNRRDGHAGILINEYWADVFNKEIKDRGWL